MTVTKNGKDYVIAVAKEKKYAIMQVNLRIPRYFPCLPESARRGLDVRLFQQGVVGSKLTTPTSNSKAFRGFI